MDFVLSHKYKLFQLKEIWYPKGFSLIPIDVRNMAGASKKNEIKDVKYILWVFMSGKSIYSTYINMTSIVEYHFRIYKIRCPIWYW